MRNLKIGVIGVGYMGNYHARLLDIMRSDIYFAGVCDIDRQRADLIGQLYKTNSYYHVDDIIDKIDLAIVAVPTQTHYEIAMKLISCGIHVLIEKPIADNYERAREIIELAKKNNIIVKIGFVERFNPIIKNLFNKLDTFKDEPIYLETKRFSYKDNRKRNSSVILDLMIHDIDLILKIMKGNRVVQINSAGKKVYSDYEDIANLQLIFSNGTIANLLASKITHKKIRQIEIAYEKKALLLDYNTKTISEFDSTKYFSPVDSSNIEEFKLNSKIYDINTVNENPLKIEIENFINSVIKHELNGSASGDELESIRIAMKAIENINK